MNRLHVAIPRSQIQKFRRWAVKYWPNEIMSAILGCGTHIHHFSAPSIGERKRVGFTDAEWEEVGDLAEENGWKFLGTIHTHCFKDPLLSPSPDDIRDSSRLAETVYGICNVWKDKDGKFHTRIAFFSSGPELTVEIR